MKEIISRPVFIQRPFLGYEKQVYKLKKSSHHFEDQAFFVGSSSETHSKFAPENWCLQGEFPLFLEGKQALIFSFFFGSEFVGKGTPWKINMEPINHPFRKENHLPNLHDYVPC